MRRYASTVAEIGFIVVLALSIPGVSDADVLRASASATSVTFGITIEGGSVLPFLAGGYTNLLGAAGGQQFNSDPRNPIIATFWNGTVKYSSISNGPLQATEPQTLSTSQAALSVGATPPNGTQPLTFSNAASASASSPFSADGFASPTFNMEFGPPNVPRTGMVDINLMSDYGVNPDSSYFLQLVGANGINPNHYAKVSIETYFGSDSPETSTLIFDLLTTITWQNGIASMSVSFNAPSASQTISASDFIVGPNGLYSLDPNKRDIVVPFVLPLHGELGGGTNVDIEIVPEPSAMALGMIGLLGLMVTLRRRQRSP